MQTCEETLERGRGSCRDSAWLLVQVLRHLGLAARFVSGYLIQLVADVKPLDGPAGPPPTSPTCTPGPRCTCPGAGWVGLDPTSGLLAGEGHIPLACTPEPAQRRADHRRRRARANVDFSFTDDASSGSTRTRASRSRTPTRQWDAIDALGRRVDADLAAGDVRLTMGGEPTFVVDRRPGRRRVEHAGARGRRSAGAPGSWCAACASASRPAGCCTSGRASGTRASRCRAGRSAATGAATASRSGSDPALLARTTTRRRRRRPRTRAASSARSRRSSASTPELAVRGATRTPGTTCGASGGCRSTSIRSTRSSRTPRSARGWPASSSAGSARWSATCCRSRRDGGRAAWRERAVDVPRAGICSSCPATRRWASACRSTRCRGSPPEVARPERTVEP